jgi:flagellar biogenesis protein FliO
MMQEANKNTVRTKATSGGLAGWLLERLRTSGRPKPRLALVERIALAPRHSLALVEAEGRRFLVATSTDGAPVFYALDERIRSRAVSSSERPMTSGPARVSW